MKGVCDAVKTRDTSYIWCRTRRALTKREASAVIDHVQIGPTGGTREASSVNKSLPVSESKIVRPACGKAARTDLSGGLREKHPYMDS